MPKKKRIGVGVYLRRSDCSARCMMAAAMAVAMVAMRGAWCVARGSWCVRVVVRGGEGAVGVASTELRSQIAHSRLARRGPVGCGARDSLCQVVVDRALVQLVAFCVGRCFVFVRR